MAMAKLFAKRSTCKRLQVGAVLVTPDGRSISQGYNGTATGQPHCPGLENHHEWSKNHEIHAEENALLFCARSPSSSIGCTLYVTTFPCTKCANHLIQAKVERVVYGSRYDRDMNNESERILQRAGIQIEQYVPPEAAASQASG